jgi:NADPH-dependent 2,4-dienoyl-CoA reductase/sulfur reductase-like enzyme
MEKWIFCSTVRQIDVTGLSRLQLDLSGSPHHSHQPDSALYKVPRMLSRIMLPGRIPHVCIVGAGVAGLRCADILLQHGIKVTIIEGRNRIGGRVRISPNRHVCRMHGQLAHLFEKRYAKRRLTAI